MFTIANAEPTFTTDVVKNEQANQSQNAIFKREYADAVSKFENLNIKISYVDFYTLITNNQNNDFLLLLIADKTAELGFYDLSNLAFSKIEDCDIANINTDNIKKFYFPKDLMTRSDTIALGEFYSNINYNDQAKETIDELSKNTKYLSDYDYANYIMALGYYNLNDIPAANRFINIASKRNPENISYKILKSKIIAQSTKPQKAKKELKELNSENIELFVLDNKIKSANEFVKYHTSKKTYEKDFYLGNYYFSEGDYPKAIRTLLSSISTNKKFNSKSYGVLSRCYLDMGEFDKALDCAHKSYKISKNNHDALLTLGDIETRNGRYKQALKYYKSARNNTNGTIDASIKMAMTYSKLSNIKKADEVYESILGSTNKSYIAYYQIGLSDSKNEVGYLKKSVEINPKFQDGWIDLARVMIEKGNLDLADKYLSNANYIDDNNFRYYYYQSLLKKKQSELNNTSSIEQNRDNLAESNE